MVLSGLFLVPAAAASLRVSPALPTSLTHTCTIRFWPNWNHLGQGRSSLGLMRWPWVAAATGGEQARPSRGTHPPTESNLARGGCCCCPYCGAGGVEEPRASQTANGCSSCFLDLRLGHGPREGWSKGRKDYGLPAHCSPNRSVAKTGKV